MLDQLLHEDLAMYHMLQDIEADYDIEDVSTNSIGPAGTVPCPEG